MSSHIPTSSSRKSRSKRKWAALAVLPFLALGLADVALILAWGVDPLWGFAILPPILFTSVLAWIGFSSGFITDHAEHGANANANADADAADAADRDND